MSSYSALSLVDAQLPEALLQAIHAQAARFTPSLLAEGCHALTERYRPLAKESLQPFKAGPLSPVQQAAYLTARLPATYAVLTAILHHAKEIAPDLCSSLKSLLDLGGGPGTTLWSVSEMLPQLQSAIVMEQEASWITLGKQLSSASTHPLLRNAQWRQSDLALGNVPHADLVVCSYVLGEMPAESLLKFIASAWESADKLLLLVEAGTPAGFSRIRSARDLLIEQGAHIVAPCTHANACPMTGSDWCHFGQKVARTSLHMRVKEGSLNIEEEKYSYLILSKIKIATPYARLLRPPRKRSKHVHLTLCSEEGLTQPVVSARHPELYRLAKDAQWGGDFPKLEKE